MLARMLLALALMIGSAPVDSRPKELVPLERLVLDCDRIVRAKVARVHEFARGPRHQEAVCDPVLEEPTIRVLELEVEETFWGRAGVQSLFVLDDPLGNMRLHGRPEKGEDSIWFLELDPWFERVNPPARDRISKLVGGPGLQVVGRNGLGRLRIEEMESQSVVCTQDEVWSLPSALPIAGGHSTTTSNRKWIQFARPAFEDWLRTTIHAATPSLEIVERWTAPGACPTLTFDKHGHTKRVDSFLGDKELDLAPGTWETILLAARRERFLELPASVGHSLAPDSTSWLLRLRTESGGRQIRLCGPADPKQDSAPELEAHARAMRVWDTIPLANEWKISGH